MELPGCQVQGCMAKVDVRLTHATTDTGVKDSHYCAVHATQVLNEINNEFDAWRGEIKVGVDRCAVHVRLVVCDSRDGYACQVFLSEVGGSRQLVFRTGRFEAWSLAWELRREVAPTLSTHRAMASVFRVLGADLRDVTINNVCDGDTYQAQVHLSHGDSLVDIEMRPSDAIILATIRDVPVYVESLVWKKVSFRQA